jgi:hypothetical protein
MLKFISKIWAVIMLVFILLSTSACIDANKHNSEDSGVAEKTLTERTVEFSNLSSSRQKSSIKIFKIDYLATAHDKKFWADAFTVLSSDELSKLNANIAELNNLDSLASFAASQNLINAKNEGIKMLINQVNSCKSDESKLKYLTTLRQCIKNVLSSEDRDKLSLILQNFTKDSSLEVKTKALAIWVKIVSEDELPALSAHLDIKNSSVRCSIYQRLSKTSALNLKVLKNLLTHLNSVNIEVRSYAVNLLRLLTGQYFEYNPLGEPISRQLAICRWTTYTIKLEKP